jgi:hypothetical protein
MQMESIKMAELIRFMTPVFRGSFLHLIKPQLPQDGKGDPKFGLSAIWTPSEFSGADKKRWAVVNKALSDEAQARFKKPLKDLPANIKRGIRNGNEKEGMEGYGEGKFFTSLTTKMRPGIVDVDRETVIHPDEDNMDLVYPGAFFRATVVAYSYDMGGGKGVALGLMNLMKVKDGDRLDSRTTANDDFADFEDEEDDNLLDA